jgi:hypothetical protein
MISIDLKKKLWFWWPLIAGAVVVAAIVGAIYYFLPQADKVEVAQSGYGSIEKLSRYSNFRRAYSIANGGEEKLASLQSMQTRGTFTSGGQSVPFHSLKRRPNQSLTTLKFPNYDLSFCVNGEMVWQRVKIEGKEPSYELKDGDEAEGLREMGEFFDPIMNVILFEKGSIQRLSVSNWESHAVLRLDFTTEKGIPSSAYIEPETMRPLARVEAFADGRQRKMLYSQYQNIAGMQEPYLVETYIDEQLTNRIELEKSEYNVGTVASIFNYPGTLPATVSTKEAPQH